MSKVDNSNERIKAEKKRDDPWAGVSDDQRNLLEIQARIARQQEIFSLLMNQLQMEMRNAEKVTSR